MSNRPRIMGMYRFQSKNKFLHYQINDVLQFEASCLDEHNRLRGQHGCPALKLDRKICKLATKSAKNLAVNCNLGRNQMTSKYGINIFQCGYDIEANEIVRSWYDDIQYFDFENFARNSIYNNSFVKMIWKSSKKIGIGIASKDNITYVVAFYDQPEYKWELLSVNVPKEADLIMPNKKLSQPFKLSNSKLFKMASNIVSLRSDSEELYGESSDSKDDPEIPPDVKSVPMPKVAQAEIQTDAI